jgi:hypothetical protein
VQTKIQSDLLAFEQLNKTGVVQVLADGSYPLAPARATALLQLLDMLIDLGDRRAAALEESETFRATQTG